MSVMAGNVQGNYILHNPIIDMDSSMKSGQKVTWDCVWFGNYPQAEVVKDASSFSFVGSKYRAENELIEDAVLYQKLDLSDNWVNNELVVNGEKYRRMSYIDSIYEQVNDIKNSKFVNSDQYKWKNDKTLSSRTDAKGNPYHYFKYQPIKWYVINVDEKNNMAQLLSANVLDDRMWNSSYGNSGREEETWKTCTIRGWLNGYKITDITESFEEYRSSRYDEHFEEEDYRDEYESFIKSYNGYEDLSLNKSFLQSAFDTQEKDALVRTSIKNGNTDSTMDYVYLLSLEEATNAEIGFVAKNKKDNARRCRSSMYAKAMGVHYGVEDDEIGNSDWWLRTKGEPDEWGESSEAYEVYDDGYITTERWTGGGDNFYGCSQGVRPVLNIDLSSGVWSYAGKATSNMEVDDVKPAQTSLPFSTPVASESSDVSEEEISGYDSGALTKLFIEQHVNYFQSEQYKSDINSPWERSDLKDIFQDYKSDVTAKTYSLLTEMENLTDSVKDSVIREFLSYFIKETHNKMPEDADYRLIMASLMLNDKEASGIKNTFSEKYVEAFEAVIDTIIDSHAIIDLPEYDTIKSAVKKLKKVIKMSGIDSEEFRNGSSALRQLMDRSITGQNAASVISDFEQKLKQFKEVGNIKEITQLFEFSGDVISEMIDYYGYGMAYIETTNEFKSVLKEVQQTAYKRSQSLHGENMEIGTESYNYHQLYIAATQFIEEMEEFSEDNISVMFQRGKEKAGTWVAEYMADEFADLLIDAVPEVKALQTAYKTGKSIVDFFSCVDEKSAAGTMLMKTAYVASVMNEVADTFGNIMQTVYNADPQKNIMQLLFGQQDQTLTSVLMFDEAINMYKNAMFLVCEYAVKYEKVLFEKTVFSDKQWHSDAIFLATAEKLVIAKISCHEPYLEYVSDGIVRFTHVWDEGVVLTAATPVTMGTMLYTCTLCGETKTETIEKSKYTLQLDRNKVTMSKGDTLVLRAKSSGTSNAVESEIKNVVKWSSSNANVATVTLGKVTAKNVGTAVITATLGDISANCTVTVIKENTDSKKVVKPQKVKLTYAESISKGKVKIKWKKCKNAKMYWVTAVYENKNGNSFKGKEKYTTKTSYTFKNLKSNKICYVSVQAINYRKRSDTLTWVYGKCSKKKKIKIK